jgi:ADP-ribose pyrophosphatase
MARGLHKGERHLDEDEFLDIHTIPLKDLVDQVMSGVLSDAKTQVCILKAARILGL